MFRKSALTVMTGILLGCGASDSTIQVTGTVKNSDGSPVGGESATVLFQPIAEGRPASGAIGPDGAFEMMTLKPGDGVQRGKYKAVLEVWEDYRARTPAVPTAYTSVATTPLEATVDADNDHFDFVVEK